VLVPVDSNGNCMKYVILEKSNWVQGRLFPDRSLRRVPAGEEDPKLGTTNLGEKLTLRGDPPEGGDISTMSIEELDAHLKRIAEEWDRRRGLEKAFKPHKYVKRTGVPGEYKYFYMEGEPRQRPTNTIEAKAMGRKMSKEEALKVWEYYKKRVAEKYPKPITHEEHEARAEHAFRSQFIREMVEGFLESDDAMLPKEIDAKMYGMKGLGLGGLGRPHKKEPEPVDTIKEIGKKYHFQEITIKNNLTDEVIVNYLHGMLDHLSGKMEIDGDGILKIKVGDIDEKNTYARYDSFGIEIELDRKYENTFAHEYAHFVFDRKISGPLRSLYYRHFPYKITDDALKEKWTSFTENPSAKNIDSIFRPFLTEGDELAKRKIEKPFMELLHDVTDFYKNQSRGGMEYIKKHDPAKDLQRFEYLFDPHEIIARAVSYYADGLTIPYVRGLEDKQEYKDIVKKWGDRYLKTGIIKSFIVLY
jgi:hypothetical protein